MPRRRNESPVGLLLVLLSFAVSDAVAATKLLVTVVQQKTGKPVSDLQVADFSVLDDRTPRRVETAEFSSGLMDVMLLLDTSLVGGMVQPVAANLIAQLQPKEQMAIVSFHSAADLIQDFTSSKELLLRAAAGVKYGNSPRLLDALYAAMEGGFQSSSFRRVLLVLTAWKAPAESLIARSCAWLDRTECPFSRFTLRVMRGPFSRAWPGRPAGLPSISGT